MDHPAFRLLLLEQGNCSLEDHTKDFVFLAPMTHYPDNSLCSAQPNITPTRGARAHRGRRARAECDRAITTGSDSTRGITAEPELIESDQVREPATEPATVDVPDGREGAEDSTAH
ncbi:Autophagy-related protein 13 [Labeo rohita]|uniref:Autophagy-related protein 13 n=1 Tax=Labeo rohita TaxID=84645 RepID=A0ABQ8LVX0_LABRO|nr:Autophagy-related protein 13 [Labeo rohita]